MENEIYFNGASESDVREVLEAMARDAAFEARQSEADRDESEMRSLYSGGGRMGEILPLAYNAEERESRWAHRMLTGE